MVISSSKKAKFVIEKFNKIINATRGREKARRF
jgi:hypothetical protein